MDRAFITQAPTYAMLGAQLSFRNFSHPRRRARRPTEMPTFAMERWKRLGWIDKLRNHVAALRKYDDRHQRRIRRYHRKIDGDTMGPSHRDLASYR